MNTDLSNVDVYLDGALRATVNCYSATRLAQQRLFTATNLPPGPHTFKLVKRGGAYMIVDAFAVVPDEFWLTATPNAATVFINWLLGRDGQEIFGRAMGVGSRRLDIETKWLKQFGVIASKDALTVEQYYRLENQSEDKVYKLREPGAAAARRLLGS